MARRGRLTIREVAEAAGVSTQTVSRVLNDRPDVAPETYDRVQRIIAEIGYSPNMLARGLTQGRSHVLGVVAFGLDYFGPSRVLTGIDQQAAEMGYAISLNLIHRPETDDVQEILSEPRRPSGGRRRSGPSRRSATTWTGRTIARSRLPVPVVLVGGMAGQTSLPSIGIDNRAIGRLATEHLLAGGARRIGLITGPRTWWEAREREAGWRETAAASALGDCAGPVFEGDWTAASGEEGLHRSAGRVAGPGRRVRQQRPDGPGRAARSPHARTPRARRPVRGRRRRHPRGFPLLAALDDGPPAPGRCRRAGGGKPRRRHPSTPAAPQPADHAGAPTDLVAAKPHRPREHEAGAPDMPQVDRRTLELGDPQGPC